MSAESKSMRNGVVRGHKGIKIELLSSLSLVDLGSARKVRKPLFLLRFRNLLRRAFEIAFTLLELPSWWRPTTLLFLKILHEEALGSLLYISAVGSSRGQFNWKSNES